MRVLICGCGYVGGALAGLLVRDGYEVFGLRRSPGELPPGVQPVYADFTDPDSLERALPAGLDYVFHTASPGVHPGMGQDEREAAYRAAYVDGPENLISALRSRDESPRRILLTSSTGVYGQSGGEWVDEASPVDSSGSGGWMLAGEETWTGGPFPGVVLRLAGIYGPGRTGALDRARRYPLQTEEANSSYTNRIHRDDCAGVLRHLMLLQDPGSLYIGADCEPATPGTIAAWLAEEHPEARDPGGSSGGGSRARTNKRCSNARLLASGYSFKYPTFREGFEALLESRS